MVPQDSLQVHDAGFENLPSIQFVYHHLVTFAIFLILISILTITKKLTANEKKKLVANIVVRLAIFYLVRFMLLELTYFKTGGGLRNILPSGHSGLTFIILFSLYIANVIPILPTILMVLVQLIIPVLTRAHHTIDPLISLFICIVLVQNVDVNKLL